MAKAKPGVSTQNLSTKKEHKTHGPPEFPHTPPKEGQQKSAKIPPTKKIV